MTNSLDAQTVAEREAKRSKLTSISVDVPTLTPNASQCQKFVITGQDQYGDPVAPDTDISAEFSMVDSKGKNLEGIFATEKCVLPTVSKINWLKQDKQVSIYLNPHQVGKASFSLVVNYTYKNLAKQLKKDLVFDVAAAAPTYVNFALAADAKDKILADGVSTTRFVVDVFDAYLNPVPKATVKVEIPGNGGAVGSVQTAENGHADLTLTSSKVAGKYFYIASVDSLKSPIISSPSVVFSAGPPAVVSLGLDSGYSASLTADGTSTTKVLATVKDLYGNPTPGASVTLSLPANGGTVVGSSTSSANDLGVAGFTIRSSTVAGTYLAQASVGSVNSLALSLTFLPGPPASVVLSVKTGQPTTLHNNATQTTILEALVKDTNNNVVPSTSATLTIPTNGGTVGGSSGPVSATTDTNGVASYTLTSSTTPGTY